MGMGGPPPPPLYTSDPNCLIPKYDGPKIRRRTKYKWDEVSGEPDLLFMEETTRIIDTACNMTQVQDRAFIKDMLDKELDPLGWEYDGYATFKANFPFRNKHVVFDSTAKLDADDRFRLKVTVSKDRGLDYKILKRVPKIGPDGWLTLKSGVMIAVGLIILFIILGIWFF